MNYIIFIVQFKDGISIDNNRMHEDIFVCALHTKRMSVVSFLVSEIRY